MYIDRLIQVKKKKRTPHLHPNHYIYFKHSCEAVFSVSIIFLNHAFIVILSIVTS